MGQRSAIAWALLVGLAGSATAAPAPPDLSEQAINAATLADWQARQKAADAEAALPSGTDADEPTASQTGDAANGRAEADGASEANQSRTEADPDEVKPEDRPDPFLVRLQVLLDRAHASPGVIDGQAGGNTEKAIRAFEEMHDMAVDGEIDDALWSALSADGAPVVRTYRLTREDVEGPYVPEIPTDYGAMAELDRLGFRDAVEMLAERFHMDEDLLRALNPDADFAALDTTILVTEPAGDPDTKVARIVVDKAKGELFAYDADDRVVLTAPATIGSNDTPSPSGRMTVNGSAKEPTYEYDPEKNFRQGANREKLTLPPGPNGPVGSMWIDLSKPTYGIHGTPEPAQVGKTASHGCVRLTNWDAQALARLVLPLETTVEFKG